MPSFDWPLIGHQKISQYLTTVIRNKKTHHGYIFYGQEGLGKRLAADLFIKSLLCQSRETIPCGSCLHCRQFDRGTHPDITVIKKDEEKKNISVEQIRQARGEASRGSFLNAKKIILIPEAETLSPAGANALLKILEEPTADLIFLLIASSLSSMPETVRSRCQLIKFLPVNTREIENYLLNGKNLGKDTARQIALASRGRPGTALTLVEDKNAWSDYGQRIKKIIRLALGTAEERFALAEELAGQPESNIAKKTTALFFEEMAGVARDILMIKNDCPELALNVFAFEELRQKARHCSIAAAAACLRQIENAQKNMAANANPRLTLENFLIQTEI